MVLEEFLSNFYSIIVNTWVFVLAGFVITFLVQYFVPKENIVKVFGKNKLKTIIYSSLTGVLLSACSYGAVPVIAGLRKKGATTASCITMLLSTPWMGLFQSVILTAYIGPLKALILLIASIILAVVTGLIFAYLEKKKTLEPPKRITRAVLESCNCEEEDKYLKEHSNQNELIDLFLFVGKNLLIGVLLAALVKTFMTSSDVSNIFGLNVLSVVYAVPLATIVETVGEGLGVFAGELYSLGANIGVVFAVMMVGVTTDITELTMLDTVFGKRTATYYTIISTLMVLFFSYLLNILL
ncbi:MAG: permease [Nanoarchaeota archaeon]|nr:permease [Nanoarchaeota archaeon]